METVVITGASSGIGQKVSRVFENAGWTVVGLSRQDVDLSKLDEVSAL